MNHEGEGEKRDFNFKVSFNSLQIIEAKNTQEAVEKLKDRFKDKFNLDITEANVELIG